MSAVFLLSVGNFDQFLTPPKCPGCLWTAPKKTSTNAVQSFGWAVSSSDELETSLRQV